MMLWSQYTLGAVFSETAQVVAMAVTLSLLIGVPLAFVSVFFRFPGRRFLSHALILPLIFPTYVLAFVWIGWMDYSGPVQTWLRDIGLMTPLSFRSKWGLGWVMGLAYYPYVYLLARHAFLSLSVRLFETSYSLGLRFPQVCRYVIWPVLWPALLAGGILVGLEALADFGAAVMFGVQSLTTTVYKVWYGYFAFGDAMKIAGLHVGIVLAFIGGDIWLKKRYRTHEMGRNVARVSAFDLGPVGQALCAIGIWGIWGIAFALPVLGLIGLSWTALMTHGVQISTFVAPTVMTLKLAAWGSVLVMVLALGLAWVSRRLRAIRWLETCLVAGYGIPGTVLSVTLFTVFGLLPNRIGSFLAGTGAILWVGYLIRFFAAGHAPLSRALQRIPNHIDEVAGLLEPRPWRIPFRVHFPLLKIPALGAGMLVFVEIAKEMPLTLMSRPFGWDTLAVSIFSYTSNGEWVMAAIPALGLTLIGFLPIMVLWHAVDMPDPD